jgi:hypothetical protein
VPRKVFGNIAAVSLLDDLQLAGLPLSLVELTRAAAAEGCATVPGSLRLAVRQQPADLPAPVLPLLQRIAVAGAVVPLERLAPDR